jgi:adenine phosphoribosyltransferase
MTRDPEWLLSQLRDIHDFPTPGIVFKDLTPLLGNPEAFRAAVDAMVEHAAELPHGSEAGGEGLRSVGVDKVVGIEARGFTFAAAVAYQMSVGLVPVRKPGKLPYKTVTETYDLEYGTDSLEIHQDALEPGQSVYVIDDVLATGGTAAATCRLVESLGARVAGLAFVVELGFLDGRAKLTDYDVHSLLRI